MPKTINKKSCPHCGQSVNQREISLFSGMIVALWKVFRWCEKSGKRNFTRKEIKSLFTNENQTARFGDWTMFGGLVERKGQGVYLLNREKTEAFFSGILAIPSFVLKNPLTGEITVEKYSTVHQIKSLTDLLTDGEFIARYRGN